MYKYVQQITNMRSQMNLKWGRERGAEIQKRNKNQQREGENERLEKTSHTHKYKQ